MRKRFSRFAPFVLAQRRNLAAIAGLTLLSSIAAAVQPWPAKLLIDYALNRESIPGFLHSFLRYLSVPDNPPALIALAAVCSIAVFIFAGGLHSLLTWLWAVTGQRMVTHLSITLFHRLQRASFVYHRNHGVGDSLSRITGDTWCVYTLMDQLLAPGEQLLTLATIGLVAWRLSPQLAMLSLMTAPVLAISTFYFGRAMKQRTKKGREAETQLLGFVHQTLASMPVVQAFTREDRNSLHFRQLADHAVELSQRGSLVTSAYGMVNGFVTTIGAAIALYVGGREVLAGRLSVGTLIVFLAYMRTMQGAAESLLQMYGTLKPVEASIDRVLEVLEPDEFEVRDLPGARRLQDGVVSGHVRIENATFGYECGLPVLQNINLEAKPGEMVALVGHTGAGKSTLISLIPRFFDPWSGRILLDGVDIREYEIASIRNQIGMVLQEPYLFPLTIAENIAYGRLGATRGEIEAAARVANAAGFIEQLPAGYDTVLGERGATLSGGERQRIAIARAVLRDAPILILDEPTSALDSHTEASLMQALERLMAGRTTFVIAHRFSTIRRSSKIVVLRDGAVAEQGTHRELLTLSGVYSHLHGLQTLTGQLQGAL